MQSMSMEMRSQDDTGEERVNIVIDFSHPKRAQKKIYWLDRDKVLKGKKWYWIGRRSQDILFSLLALTVLAVPMLVIALVIWVDSPGASPIFSQDRVGRDGKIFKFYKFRSMVSNAEAKLNEILAQNEMNGPVFKIKNDPRI